MDCRQIQTVGRNAIMEDPIFATARQTLSQAIDDFRISNINMGLPVPQVTQTMSQALTNQYTIQTQTPFIPQNAGPLSAKTTGEDRMTFKPDRFEIIMDVQGFTPQDIAITLQGNIVQVAAERKSQSGDTAQLFSMTRRYHLPQNIRTDRLESNLSCDGVLVLSAPWLA